MRTAVYIGLVAIAGAFAGFFLYRGFATKPTLVEAPTATIVPPKEQSVPAPVVVPSRIPAVTLVNRAGAPTSVLSFNQPIVIYNFWATWCTPCRREIPLLNQLRRERAQSLEVVGIAVDFRDAVLKYASEIGIGYPLLIGEEDGLQALDAFGVPGAFPVSVFADQQKRIVMVKLGELHADEAGFILDRIGDLNAGRIDMAGAKQQISAKLQEFARNRAKAKSASVDAASQQPNPG
jgi:thiol-disulfide isomerase/thioredoxin